MQIPSYGAAPLSATFLIVRGLELVCMLCIVGLTSNFIGQIVSSNVEPAQEFIGALAVTCIATLYCLISVPFFWSVANIGLLVMAAADSLLLIAFIVVAVAIGKPVSYLNCYIIDDQNEAIEAASAHAFTESVRENLGEDLASLDGWAGVTKGNCFQTKAVWGFGIALCILFTTSTILLPTLFYKQKKTAAASLVAAKGEGDDA